MTSKMAPEPIEVELKRTESILRVAWDDGHESLFPLRYLRGYCPCAHCQGHGGHWDFVRVDTADLVSIQEVGNYALSLVWADGHSTGIYGFDVLRQLCPCESCQKRQGSSHPMHRMG